MKASGPSVKTVKSTEVEQNFQSNRPRRLSLIVNATTLALIVHDANHKIVVLIVSISDD